MYKCNRNLHGMRNLMLPLEATKLSADPKFSEFKPLKALALASHAINLGRAELCGSGPKETSSSLISIILKRGKFT